MYRRAVVADVHRILAFVAIGLFAVVGLGAALSAVRSRADRAAVVVDALLLAVVGLAIALGAVLLIGGSRPRELLHFVYAVAAFAAVPVADLVALEWSDRRRGIARVVASLIGIAVVVRSFATG